MNLKDDPSPAFQLRRYAWSARLPVSILTDFQEFAIYNCRQRLDQSDKASNGRIHYVSFHQYAEHWDYIAGIFSREAVYKGAFDQFAESNRGKHGTAEVDDAFLAEIERWRDLLARNIALRNPSLTQRDMDNTIARSI